MPLNSPLHIKFRYTPTVWLFLNKKLISVSLSLVFNSLVSIILVKLNRVQNMGRTSRRYFLTIFDKRNWCSRVCMSAEPKQVGRHSAVHRCCDNWQLPVLYCHIKLCHRTPFSDIVKLLLKKMMLGVLSLMLWFQYFINLAVRNMIPSLPLFMDVLVSTFSCDITFQL